MISFSSSQGSEVWTGKSNLLQLLVSIQGLILNSEPYFNEAGYDKHRGTTHGTESSRMYNETVLIKVMQVRNSVPLICWINYFMEHSGG